MQSQKFTSILETRDKNSLTIEVPDNLRGKRIKVTMEESRLKREDKIKLIKLASTDALFQTDVEEIKNDFEFIDNESL